MNDRTINFTHNKTYRIQKILERAYRQYSIKVPKYYLKGKRCLGRHLKQWKDSFCNIHNRSQQD